MKARRGYEEKKIHKLPSEAFSRKNVDNVINYSTNPKDYIEDFEDEFDDHTETDMN